MLIRILLSLIFFQPFALAGERDVAVSQALTFVQEKKAEALSWEGQHSDQPYIILLNEYETRINPDWSYEESYHARIRIQKESAKDLGEWPVFYNKSREEILEIKAFVESPEGKIFKATKIQDMQAYENSPLYSDMKVKVISFPQVNIGSVLDVTVKTKAAHKEIENHFWDVAVFPVVPTKFSRHTYIFPQDKGIDFKAINTDAKPIMEQKDGVIKYSFVFENTGDFQAEEMMPPLDQVNAAFYLSSIKDWKTIADWYRELNNKNVVDDQAIKDKVAVLTKDKTTQKDKARSIIEFVQDNFRYVAMNFGEHTVKPHPTKEIFQNRYGDCKDLALLVKQMLKIAGIESNLCLMNSEFSGNPQNALPNPSAFEHVILEISLDGKDYFADPQAKGFDFGQYPSGYDNGHVLVIGPQGYRFDNLPVVPETERSLVTRSDINLNPDGSALFDVNVKLPLETSQEFRMQWASTTDENKDKFFASLEDNFAQGGTMITRNVKGLEDRYGSVEFHLKYQSPTAYPVVNDMMLLKEAEQSSIPEFSAPQRKYPIFLPTNSLIDNLNTYKIPEGFKVDFMPTSYQIGIDFVEINAQYTAKADSVTVHNRYRLKRSMIPPAKYPEVKKFRTEVYKKNDQYIVLKQKSQASVQVKDWIKAQ